MFAATAASRAWQPEPDRVGGLAGALTSPGVRTLLATMTVVGAGVGMIEVAVPALCEAAGRPSATGFVLGVWGFGSLVGGVVASRLSAGEDPGGRVIVLLGALAAGTAPLVLASGVVTLGALMFVAGVAIAPALAAVHSLTGQLAVRGTVTEAYTWLGTGMGAGIAIGAGVGGVVVEGAGTGEAFLLSRLRCRARRGGGRRPALEPPAGLTRHTTRPENSNERCLNGRAGRQGGDRDGLGPRHRPRDGRAARVAGSEGPHQRSRRRCRRADRVGDRRRDRRLRRRPDQGERAGRARQDRGRRVGQARHRRQQRRLHDRRARPQDERRPVPEDARYPQHRPLPRPARRRAAPARAGQAGARPGRRGLPQGRQRLLDLRARWATPGRRTTPPARPVSSA